MKKLIVEPSPHIRSKNSTRLIMLNVIIAMLPALVASVYIFGPRALTLTVVCVVACVLSEFFFKKITKQENTVNDLSAVVTGMLLAFNLPVTLPYYIAVIGCIAAIVVVKQMFGGIGQNFANPAITARIFLMISFATQMTTWTEPFYYKSIPFNIGTSADVVTAATPLAADKAPELMDLFLGVHGGSLGETCALALLIGFIYLLIIRIINPVTPLAFAGTVALITFATGGDVGFELLSGGLILGAVFMATDYSTTPITIRGKLIFGFGCGILTIVIRNFGGMPEGVSFSILIMNILTPYIGKATRTRPFGYVKKPGKAHKFSKFI